MLNLKLCLTLESNKDSSLKLYFSIVIKTQEFKQCNKDTLDIKSCKDYK